MNREVHQWPPVAIWHAVVGVGGREHDDGIAKPELGVRDGAVVSGLTSREREADRLEPIDRRRGVPVALR
jgi:hypothetical protein